MAPVFDSLKKAFKDVKDEVGNHHGGMGSQYPGNVPQAQTLQPPPPPPQQRPLNPVPTPKPRPPPNGPVMPRVKGEVRLMGLLGDPRLNRDSGGCVRFGDRVFWAYRDTQLCDPNGSVRGLPIICNTASWSNYQPNGTPAFAAPPPGADLLRTNVLRQYGQMPSEESFYSLRYFDCAPAGNRDDGTRICIWPDVPPVVVSTSPEGHIIAYCWIRRSHITNDLGVVNANPATALYRIDYNPQMHRGETLPQVTLVDKEFWAENGIPFGIYGTVLAKDGTLYLWAQTGEGMAKSTFLARVPVQHLENKSAYEYFVGGAWTSQMPALGQQEAELVNSNAGGQGNYYFSEPWQSYVWIGGGPFPGPNFLITTAPAPEGPWVQPFEFFRGVNGDHFLGSYSLQALHDLIADPNHNGIYITYTKNDKVGDGAVYTHPLYYVEWE